jgi:hypothetical protein
VVHHITPITSTDAPKGGTLGHSSGRGGKTWGAVRAKRAKTALIVRSPVPPAQPRDGCWTLRIVGRGDCGAIRIAACPVGPIDQRMAASVCRSSAGCANCASSGGKSAYNAPSERALRGRAGRRGPGSVQRPSIPPPVLPRSADPRDAPRRDSGLAFGAAYGRVRRWREHQESRNGFHYHTAPSAHSPVTPLLFNCRREHGWEM